MLNFCVIGVQKAGTTWMFDKLKMHPKIYFPFGKEINFWNKRYQQRFWETTYLQRMRGGAWVKMSGVSCGDITPDYVSMSLPEIENLRKHFPDVQIFLLVRHPVTRAWSHLRMTYRYYEKDITKLSDERIARELSSGKRAEYGSYEVIIPKWRQVFDSEHFHVLFFDDLASRYREVLTDVCKRVDVSPRFFEHMPSSFLSEKSLEGGRHALAEPVFHSALERYKASIDFLADYTGRDLSGWLNMERAA